MIEKTAFDMAERIRLDYLKVHPISEENTIEPFHLLELAQEIADECMLYDLIYQ